MLDLNSKMTPHEYVMNLEKVVSEMTPAEIAQFIIYLREEAYNNKLQLSPVTVGYLADIAYNLASPQSRREWERSIASILGTKGGSKTSEAKAAAARENGRKGGRPKKEKNHLN